MLFNCTPSRQVQPVGTGVLRCARTIAKTVSDTLIWIDVIPITGDQDKLVFLDGALSLNLKLGLATSAMMLLLWQWKSESAKKP